MFADVVGSMDLAEALDPEDWSVLVDQFFRTLSQSVVQFGGVVQTFTGDGIMALFGAPVSQEDHARRACAAALDMREATAELELGFRIGINSGEVVVTGLGEQGQLDHATIGHTVGLAQRMESIADTGTICVTDQTARLVQSHFSLADLGVRVVKGSKEPLRIWRLNSSKHAAVRSAGSSALVGRDEEMAVLDDAIARARGGDAQIVGVVGEAGVGKSRLCDDFARRLAADGIRVRRAAGVSHAQDAPLLPVLELLRDYFEINDADPMAAARAKVTSWLMDLDPSLEPSIPLLLDFMEIPDPGRPVPRLSPEVRMEQILGLIRRITHRRTDRETLVLVLEDMHWFDVHSVRFFEQLIRSFPGTRTLMLTNFRPDFSPPWGDQPDFHLLPLKPLDLPAVNELLDGLLGLDPSVARLGALIADSTSGSPFFIEEVVRSLVENESLVGQPGAYQLTHDVERLEVPATVQAALSARIDRLSDAEKGVLQAASIIGRNFSGQILQMAAEETPDQVHAALARLCAAEFVIRIGDGVAEEYRFWHPLTQEVASRSMLRDRRRALHRRVAEAIIAMEPTGLSERAALLANHYEQAGEIFETAQWQDRAADFALRSDTDEAVRRWRVVADLVGLVPESDAALRLGIQTANRLIRHGARTGMDPEEGRRLFADATAMAERLGDPAQLALATVGYGSDRHWRGAVSDALVLYVKAADLAHAAGDLKARASYLGTVALCSAFTGPLSLARDASDEIDRLCGGDPKFGFAALGWSPLSPMHFTRAEIAWFEGEGEQARSELDALVAGARERGETEFVIWASATYARMSSTRSEFEASHEIAVEMIELAQATGNKAGLSVALGGAGIAEVGLGRYAEAIVDLERGLSEARKHQTGLFEEARSLAHLARAHEGLGDQGTALEVADHAVEIAQQQGARLIECLALITRAAIRDSAGRPAGETVGDLEAALLISRDTGATLYAAEAVKKLREL